MADPIYEDVDASTAQAFVEYAELTAQSVLAVAAVRTALDGE